MLSELASDSFIALSLSSLNHIKFYVYCNSDNGSVMDYKRPIAQFTDA